MSDEKITREFIGGPKDGQTTACAPSVRFVEIPNFSHLFNIGRYALRPDGALHWLGWEDVELPEGMS